MVETQMTRPLKPGITKKTCDLSATNTINQFLHHCFPISPYVIPPKPRQWSLNIRGSRGARDHQWRPTWWLFRWKPPAAASRRGSWAAWLLGCPFFWGESLEIRFASEKGLVCAKIGRNSALSNHEIIWNPRALSFVFYFLPCGNQTWQWKLLNL